MKSTVTKSQRRTAFNNKKDKYIHSVENIMVIASKVSKSVVFFNWLKSLSRDGNVYSVVIATGILVIIEAMFSGFLN